MKLLSQARFRGSVSRSLLTAGTRFLDLPTRYGLHFLIVARLSIGDVGRFYIVFSLMTLAAGFGRLGIDRALTREVAAALGRDEPGSIRPAIARAFRITLLQTGVVVALLAVCAVPLSSSVLHKPGLALPLLLGVLTILPQNVSTAAAGALAGLGHVASSQMIYSWLWPALFCLAAFFTPLTVISTLLLIGLSLLIDAAVGIGLLLRKLPPASEQSLGLAPFRYSVGLSFFSLEIVQLAIASAPAFVLGIVASAADVGRYALAWRIVLVLNLLGSAMAAIASPQFARAHAQGDDAALRQISAQTVGITVALSILPLIVLAARPDLFLNRFGVGYDAASSILRILLAGQAVVLLCTATPELLGMAGLARSLTRINLVSLAVLLIGLAVLAKHFGSDGAAAATALTMALNAVAVTFAVRRDLGFVPIVSVFRKKAA